MTGRADSVTEPPLFHDTPAPRCSPEDTGTTRSFRSRCLGHCRVIDVVKLMERGRVIDMRKRFILWNGHAQERAERFPPLLDIKDQKPLRGDRLAHRLNVLAKVAWQCARSVSWPPKVRV